MAYSTYISQKMQDHIFGGATFTQASTLYIGLFISSPDPTNTYGQEVSTSGTGYARASIANNLSTGWQGATSANPSTKSNQQAIVFPTPTAAWGIIGFFGVFDAATGGNLYAFGSLVSPINVVVGVTPEFLNPGDFQLNLQ